MVEAEYSEGYHRRVIRHERQTDLHTDTHIEECRGRGQWVEPSVSDWDKSPCPPTQVMQESISFVALVKYNTVSPVHHADWGFAALRNAAHYDPITLGLHETYYGVLRKYLEWEKERIKVDRRGTRGKQRDNGEKNELATSEHFFGQYVCMAVPGQDSLSFLLIKLSSWFRDPLFQAHVHVGEGSLTIATGIGQRDLYACCVSRVLAARANVGA